MAGLVAYEDLDERAIDALREFNEEGALTVLLQFKESDLSHVQVGALKSSLARGDGGYRGVLSDAFSVVDIIMENLSTEQKCFPLWCHEDVSAEGKARKQSTRIHQGPRRDQNQGKPTECPVLVGNSAFNPYQLVTVVDLSLNTCFVVWFVLCFQALLDRTGYTLDVTTGQRKYGGPPPPQVFTGCQPGVGTEVNDRGGTLSCLVIGHREAEPACRVLYEDR